MGIFLDAFNTAPKDREKLPLGELPTVKEAIEANKREILEPLVTLFGEAFVFNQLELDINSVVEETPLFDDRFDWSTLVVPVHPKGVSNQEVTLLVFFAVFDDNTVALRSETILEHNGEEIYSSNAQTVITLWDRLVAR